MRPQSKTTRREVFAAAIGASLAILSIAPAARAADGVLITFTSGTGDTSGKITVTNAGNGSTTSVGLAPKLPASVCADTLSTAAQKIGLKAELVGNAVKIFSRSAVVKVEGAATTKTDF
jgi:hypothetical protein